jgi:hypothetical protein
MRRVLGMLRHAADRRGSLEEIRRCAVPEPPSGMGMRNLQKPPGRLSELALWLAIDETTRRQLAS